MKTCNMGIQKIEAPSGICEPMLFMHMYLYVVHAYVLYFSVLARLFPLQGRHFS